MTKHAEISLDHFDAHPDKMPLMLHESVASGKHPDHGEFEIWRSGFSYSLVMRREGGEHYGITLEGRGIVDALFDAWEKQPK